MMQLDALQEIVLVIHLIFALAIVVLVLLQRSEGGALGMGGGGGGMVTGREAANFLSKTTAILAACFFITSLSLTVIANNSGERKSLADRVQEKTPVANQPVMPKKPAVPVAE